MKKNKGSKPNYTHSVKIENSQKVAEALEKQNIPFTTEKGIVYAAVENYNGIHPYFERIFFTVPSMNGKQFTKFLATLGIGYAKNKKEGM